MNTDAAHASKLCGSAVAYGVGFGESVRAAASKTICFIRGLKEAVQSHEHYMQRALELATRGSGCTTPNPLVGSLVVRDGVILGEGWHEVYGQGHAEANAIRRAHERHASLEGATIYVTLEPCNHQGATPPCTQAIVATNFKKKRLINLA